MDAIALIPRSTPRSGATLTFGTRRRGWRMRTLGPVGDAPKLKPALVVAETG
jgi:hypothetical protein